ncbi:unnamed protein product [Discosporangium mesarthrocarpum]
MANNKSAKKRIKINERNRIRNSSYKSIIKTLTKKYFNSIENYKNESTSLNLILVKNNLNLIFSKIDKATKNNVLHKNTASRRKSRLFKKFYSLKLIS